MLDSDPAELYGVETKALNQAASRNSRRFPERFCFRITREEAKRQEQASGHVLPVVDRNPEWWWDVIIGVGDSLYRELETI